MLVSATDQLSRARSVMERSGDASPDLLSPEISASWTRCLELGLDPQRAPPLDAVDEAQLKVSRERVELVRSLALAEMQTLYHQRLLSGSGVVIRVVSLARI